MPPVAASSVSVGRFFLQNETDRFAARLVLAKTCFPLKVLPETIP
jgi:hypothetical protein